MEVMKMSQIRQKIVRNVVEPICVIVGMIGLYMLYKVAAKHDYARELDKAFHTTPAVISLDSMYKSQRDSLDKAYHLRLDSMKNVYLSTLSKMDSSRSAYMKNGLEKKIERK
jgi:hypothetical protein